MARSEAPALRKLPGTATPIRLPPPRQSPTLLHYYSRAVYWNMCYMDKAANYLRRQGRLPDLDLLRYVSPLGWYHIGLTGDYNWHAGAAERMNARPLNLYATRIPA